MQIWKIDPTDSDLASAPEFADAIEHLRAGRLVAIPTETVYGLAADATNGAAVAAIYAAKERPRFNPLICHVDSLATAETHGHFSDAARALANTFWPGPLTMVLPRRATSPVADLATAGLDTIALRVPASPIVHALSRALGAPLAAPSANRSGRISATSAEAAVAELGERIAMVIDAGPCPVGVESTIVAVNDEMPRLLRPGGIARAEIEAVLGKPLAGIAATDDERPTAPGMLSSHYAPNASVRLGATEVEGDEALLAFGPAPVKGAESCVAVINLSPASDLSEAAQGLFSALRTLDESGARGIAVMAIPDTGLGEAINDRLRRAAAPRP
ncbi:MAG: threonylcarbamoyl-AMP synthase [Hyphomicrobiales bacterium]|nr:MAG: threonylcarbamoyl-AMP synthase [Hyphomicrobiales bacterium]